MKAIFDVRMSPSFLILYSNLQLWIVFFKTVSTRSSHQVRLVSTRSSNPTSLLFRVHESENGRDGLPDLGRASNTCNSISDIHFSSRTSTLTRCSHAYPVVRAFTTENVWKVSKHMKTYENINKRLKNWKMYRITIQITTTHRSKLAPRRLSANWHLKLCAFQKNIPTTVLTRNILSQIYLKRQLLKGQEKSPRTIFCSSYVLKTVIAQRK